MVARPGLQLSSHRCAGTPRARHIPVRPASVPRVAHPLRHAGDTEADITGR